MLSTIFDQFVEASPISVMARGLMENIFAPEKMNKIFDTHAQHQFQQELLFSSQVDLMSLVVCGMHPSIHAAYQAKAAAISVSTTVQPQQLWIGDRNFCTTKMLWSINQRQAWFGFRQHGTLGWTPITELVAVGMTETGEVFEQEVEITGTKQPLRLRRVVVKLLQPTRDKDWEIAILTNLSANQADAITIADLYRDRWRIETLFQTITKNFNGEIQTLAYPKAALFSLCLALVVYNILATLKAALGSVHGVEKIDAGLSDFYLVDEIQGTYRGMMIAIPPPHWQEFASMELPRLSQVLQYLAHFVHLKRFLKHPRGVKNKRAPLIIDRKHRHISTHRLLNPPEPPLLQ